MKLPVETIMASGPVIIEDGKVLLNKEKKGEKISPWFFPGGEVEEFDITLEEACIREAKEEMGINVHIIKPLRPILIPRPEQPDQLVILIHFLAKRSGEITPGDNVVDWAWHDIHNLPDDCAPNVSLVINDYLQTQDL